METLQSDPELDLSRWHAAIEAMKAQDLDGSVFGTKDMHDLQAEAEQSTQGRSLQVPAEAFLQVMQLLIRSAESRGIPVALSQTCLKTLLKLAESAPSGEVVSLPVTQVPGLTTVPLADSA